MQIENKIIESRNQLQTSFSEEEARMQNKRIGMTNKENEKDQKSDITMSKKQ